MALRCLWEVIRDLGYALWPLRMIFLPVTVTGAALLALPQAQEILVKLGQDPRFVDWVFFAAAAGWFAFNAWYWGRFILGLQGVLPFDRLPLERCGTSGCGGRPWFGGQTARIRWLTAYLPRLLGSAALFLVAGALGSASQILSKADSDTRRLLIAAAAAFAVTALMFYLVVWLRRPVLSRMGMAIPVAPPQLSSIRDLPVVLGISTGISLVVFTLSWFYPVRTGTALGPAAILFLAATAWIAFGTLLVYAGQATGLPIIAGIAAIAFLSSLLPDRGIFADNHDVRLLTKNVPPHWARAEEQITPYFDKWAAQQPADRNGPIIIVATAGGGIRAAYWTATVLGQLTDLSLSNAETQGAESGSRPVSFDRQLFAISGVSGGSLGAAIYRALLIERSNGTKQCNDEKGQPSVFKFANCGQAALSGDFLGPTLAAALFPDLVQRIFPFRIFPDRAEAIEKAWETSWRRSMGSDRLGQDFLAQRNDGGPLPALLLNGTSVGNGRRLITASFPIAFERQDGVGSALTPEHFVDVSGSTVRLSTAVNNSARFSWVGPAGTIRTAKGDIPDRVVDGGYFENFGATTAMDLIHWLDKQGRLGHNHENLIVVLISSDPDLYAGETQSSNCNAQLAAPAYSSERGGEVLTPVVTLMRTREARGSYAAYELQDLVGADRFFHFHLLKQTDIRDAPLGWTLSARAQGAIRGTWSSCQNSDTMRRLAGLLHWTLPKTASR